MRKIGYVVLVLALLASFKMMQEWGAPTLKLTDAEAGTITVDAFLSGNDVTIEHLNTFRTTVLDVINGNLDSNNLKDREAVGETEFKDDSNPRIRWDESFNDFVVTGLSPDASASLVTNMTAGTAYIGGYRVTKDAVSHTYGASKWTYNDLSNTGTYTYSATAINAAEPAVTTNSIRLCRVSTDGTKVFSTRDDRVTSIQLETNQDPYRTGFEISVVTPDAISITPGVTYHGTTRVSKTAATTLNIGTATDWVSDISGRATGTFGYVVTDSAGVIQLTTTAPGYVDTSANTTGRKRYSYVGSTYYRALGWFYMNATGSGNIDWWGYGNIKDGDVGNIVMRWDKAYQTVTYKEYNQITRSLIPFYSTGRPVKIIGALGVFLDSGGSTDVWICLSADSVMLASSEATITGSATGYGTQGVIDFVYTPTQGAHTYNINFKQNTETGNTIKSVSITATEE